MEQAHPIHIFIAVVLIILFVVALFSWNSSTSDCYDECEAQGYSEYRCNNRCLRSVE